MNIIKCCQTSGGASMQYLMAWTPTTPVPSFCMPYFSVASQNSANIYYIIYTLLFTISGVPQRTHTLQIAKLTALLVAWQSSWQQVIRSQPCVIKKTTCDHEDDGHHDGLLEHHIIGAVIQPVKICKNFSCALWMYITIPALLLFTKGM